MIPFKRLLFTGLYRLKLYNLEHSQISVVKDEFYPQYFHFMHIFFYIKSKKKQATSPFMRMYMMTNDFFLKNLMVTQTIIHQNKCYEIYSILN